MSEIELKAAPKVAILGAGAIGQLLYHQLSAAGTSPYFITRKETLSKQTLTFTSLENKVRDSEAQLLSSDNQSHSGDQLASTLASTELIIVCVKAYQVRSAIYAILSRLPKQCHILLLHNGMGPHLEVAKQLSTQGLSVGTTSQGALKLAPWHIQQTGSGTTQFGHVSGSKLPDTLKALLLNAIAHSQWCNPILPLLWQKLAINAVINPLTAIEQCRNGDLAAPRYQAMRDEIISELVEVAHADGIELDKLVLTNRIDEVIKLTANNFSSMHQDVANKRQTEIEAISGYIIKRAAIHGLIPKANQQLFEQVKTLESRYLS